MAFILTLIDADRGLSKIVRTLSQLLAEGLPEPVRNKSAGIHSFEPTDGEPTDDEKFLFDEFTKAIETFNPMTGIHTAESALAAAIKATNERIAKRLSGVRNGDNARIIGTCEACRTDEIPVREYGEDRGTCERQAALCDLCASLLFGNTARQPTAKYGIEYLARDLVALFRGVYDRLDRIEKGKEG